MRENETDHPFGYLAPGLPSVEAAVSGVPGWTPIDQLWALYCFALSAPAGGPLIEVGTWCGRSAVTLGLAARARRDCMVVAIDIFPEWEDWIQNEDSTWSISQRDSAGELVQSAYVSQRVWPEPFESDIRPVYETWGSPRSAFEHALAAVDLGDIVTPFVGDFQSWVAGLQEEDFASMVFLDGDHSFESVRSEIALAEQVLLPGGWLLLDDSHSFYEGVDAAIAEGIVGRPQEWSATQQITRKMFAARRR